MNQLANAREGRVCVGRIHSHGIALPKVIQRLGSGWEGFSAESPHDIGYEALRRAAESALPARGVGLWAAGRLFACVCETLGSYFAFFLLAMLKQGFLRQVF